MKRSRGSSHGAIVITQENASEAELETMRRFSGLEQETVSEQNPLILGLEKKGGGN